MVTPTRTDTGWDFPPLHVGVCRSTGWLIHVERATAAVLARYREDQAVKRRILGFWRHRRSRRSAAVQLVLTRGRPRWAFLVSRSRRPPSSGHQPSSRRADLLTAAADVSACPHPFDGRRIDYVVPAGLTIAEIVELIQPDPLLRAHGVAFIGEHAVPRDRWHRVRPKPGALLSIRLLPSGGGGLRIGLMIVVAVAAIALTIATPAATSPLLFGLSGATWGDDRRRRDFAHRHAADQHVAATAGAEAVADLRQRVADLRDHRRAQPGAAVGEGPLPVRPVQADAGVRGAAVPRGGRRRHLLASAVRARPRADPSRRDAHR